jgi:Cu(I)/Ag(I) efflux system membrane fusion protein
MHPEVTSDDPDATCTQCGMKLRPRPGGPADPRRPAQPAAAPAPAGHAAHAVPGLVPIQLTPERIQLMGMRTAPVVRDKLGSALRTVGYVAADEEGLAMIHTRYAGWIEHHGLAQTGQPVKKGEVLATIFSPDLLAAQQDYLNAVRWNSGGAQSDDSAHLNATLEADARRRLELLGVSEQEIAAIRKRGEPLHAMALRSPVDGYITEKNAVVGLYVQPGTEIFTVADLSKVWVVADLYEYEVSRVRVGQKATLTLVAYPGQRFTGRVQFIYPAIDAQTRTLRVRLEFRNPGLKLRPGMYGDVTLELPSSEALSVPNDAVVDTGREQYVFVALAGGRFEPRRVRLAGRDDERSQVLSGVREGEQVVTTANFLVDSESRLRAAIDGFATGDESTGAARPAAAAPAPGHQH